MIFHADDPHGHDRPPSCPVGLKTVSYLREHEVVAAIGQTDATPAQTLEAVWAGVTVATLNLDCPFM